jgi:hypothetical protein
MTEVEALTRQEELFGPGGGASDSIVLRALDELAGGSAWTACPADGWRVPWPEQGVGPPCDPSTWITAP